MPSADDLRLPSSLAWLREIAGGRAWLGSLPNLMAEVCSRRSLALGDPYDGSYVSLVLPAVRDGDSSLVVKLQFPHRKSEHEAADFVLGTGTARFD